MTDPTSRALQKLAKWRSVLAGWQLGTRSSDDPECAAVRDMREAQLLMRAETNAAIRLLFANGIITEQQFSQALREEALALDQAYEKRFPGITTTDTGVVMTPEAAEYMRHWRP